VRTRKAGTAGKDGEGRLSARLWRVMRYVDAIIRDIVVSDEVFEAIRRDIGNERQIVELSMYTIVFCHLLCRKEPAVL
jgi:hypothetical protein